MRRILISLFILALSFRAQDALAQAASPSNAPNSKSSGDSIDSVLNTLDAHIAKQKAQNALECKDGCTDAGWAAKYAADKVAADAAAKTHDGCCVNPNNFLKAISYCKNWAAHWDKESPAWQGINERTFGTEVPRTTISGVTTYCPDVLIDQYNSELSLAVPNWCFGQPGSIYKSEDEQRRWGAAEDCAPVHRTVTLPEKELAEMAIAKDKEFAQIRCQLDDPRSVNERNADPVCIQLIQKSTREYEEGELLKQRQQVEARKEAQLQVVLAARQKSFRALGLHREQSQAQVKSLLLSHGFAPWSCTTKQDITAPSGYSTTCAASRRRGLPDQDNVVLLFVNVIHRHRDPDTGISVTDNVERLLAFALYAREGDERDTRFGDNNAMF